MNSAGYTEALPEVVTMAFAPLRAFGELLSEYNVKDVSLHPFNVGMVASALVDYSERRLAAALAVIEDKVGHISVGFAGDACSIADNVVDAELSPAPKKKPRASAVVSMSPAKDGVHHG